MSRKRVWIEMYVLSPQEHFICQGLAQGLGYKQIAGVLDMKEGTVRAHARDAMKKLGVGDWPTLARVYTLMREIEELVPTRVYVRTPRFNRKSN